MTKTFYFNGCSMSYGADLLDPLKTRYSYLVSSAFNAEENNFSICGSSNFRLSRHFTEYVSQNKPVLVFIMWSQPSRIENVFLKNTTLMFDPPYQQIHARWVLEHGVLLYLSDDLEVVDINNDEERTLAYEYFYTYIYTDENHILNWLHMVLTIQNYCKSNNIPLVMTHAFPDTYKLLKWALCHNNTVLREKVAFYYDQIDWSCWINGGDWNFREFNDDELKLPLGPTEHPLEDAHKSVANIVVDFINEKYGKEFGLLGEKFK